MSREYSGTGVATFQAVPAVLFVRNAIFLPARFRHETVPEVLPNGPVFSQVDFNGHLAALLIGDKLHFGHGSIPSGDGVTELYTHSPASAIVSGGQGRAGRASVGTPF